MKIPRFVQRQMRRRKRVYIMPTKMGGYLNGLIFLMFLLSVGYSNNLLLIFTLFLFGFNLLWVIQTHFQLQKLKLGNISVPNAHADGPFSFKIIWEQSPPPPLKWSIEFISGDESIQALRVESDEKFSSGEFKLSRRGAWNWDYLLVSTEMPYGLYHVWIYYPLQNAKTLAYPKLVELDKKLELLGIEKDGENSQLKAGPWDIFELASYQGEEFRKISWKHYAKSGELLIKQGEELNSPIWKHTLHLPDDEVSKEKYLSETTTLMVYCFRNQISFYFDTSIEHYGPAADEQHLHRCLQVLSLC